MNVHTTLDGSLFVKVYTLFRVQNDNELIYRMGCTAVLFTGVVGIYTAFQPAPYGKFSRSWAGPTINAKLAWMVQEIPAWMNPFILMYQSPWVWKMSVPNVGLTILFVSHYLQRSRSHQVRFVKPNKKRDKILFKAGYTCFLLYDRCFVYPLRIREAAKPVPLLTAVSSFLVCSFNGLYQCHHLMNVEKVENFVFFIPGVTLFVVGMFINVHHDGILLALKRSRIEGDKNDSTEYKIPRGALFEYVSGANYFGEMVEWWGFALASGKIPQFVFAVFSTVFLGIRAWHQHKYYKKLFGVSYPSNRTAVIPYII